MSVDSYTDQRSFFRNAPLIFQKGEESDNRIQELEKKYILLRLEMRICLPRNIYFEPTKCVFACAEIRILYLIYTFFLQLITAF